MNKDYPKWACAECGAKHGKITGKIATWHYGKCDVCGKNNNVTEPRDFGHFPNWFKPKQKKVWA
jgi:predicted ATP-dependent serine protease